MGKCEEIIDAIFEKEKTVSDVFKKKKKEIQIDDDPGAKKELVILKKGARFFGNLGKMAKDYAERRVKEAINEATAEIRAQINAAIADINNVLQTAEELAKQAKKLTDKKTYARLADQAKKKAQEKTKEILCNNSITRSVAAAGTSISVAVKTINNYSNKEKKALQSGDSVKKSQATEAEVNKTKKSIENGMNDNITMADAEKKTASTDGTDRTGIFQTDISNDIYKSSYFVGNTNCVFEYDKYTKAYEKYNTITKEIQDKYSKYPDLDALLTKYDTEDRIFHGEKLFNYSKDAVLQLHIMNHSLYDIIKNCDSDREKDRSTARLPGHPLAPILPSDNLGPPHDIFINNDHSALIEIVNIDTHGDIHDVRDVVGLYLNRYGKEELRIDLYPIPLLGNESIHDKYWSLYYTIIGHGEPIEPGQDIGTFIYNSGEVEPWPTLILDKKYNTIQQLTIDESNNRAVQSIEQFYKDKQAQLDPFSPVPTVPLPELDT